MFSVDTQQLKNEKISITEPCRENLEPRFLIKSGYYFVASPSTALVFLVCFGLFGYQIHVDTSYSHTK